MNIKNLEKYFPTVVFWSKLPALNCAILFISGIIVGNFLSSEMEIPFLVPMLFFLIALVQRKKVIMTICIFLGGITAYQWGFSEHIKLHTILSDKHQKKLKIQGKISSMAYYYKGEQRYTLAIHSIFTSTDTIHCSRGSIVITDSTPYFRNTTIDIEGFFYYRQTAERKFSQDNLGYLTNANSSIISEPSSLEKNFISYIETFTKKYNNHDIREIIPAILLGFKKNLNNETKNNFRTSGLYHLLAISGLHVGILSASIYFLLHFLPMPKSFKGLILLLTLWLYLLLIGFIPSLTRAIIMATFIILGLHIERKQILMNTLGTAAIFWLLLNPHSLFTPAFQLSFAATASIIVLTPILQSQFEIITRYSFLNKMGNFFLVSFYVSLSGFLGTAPIIIFHFEEISLYGLIANCFAVPITSVALNSTVLSIAISPVFPLFGQWTQILSEVFFECLLAISNTSNLFSFSKIHISFYSIIPFFLYTISLIAIMTISIHLLRKLLLVIILICFLIIPLDYLFFVTTTQPIQQNFSENNFAFTEFTNRNERIIIITKKEISLKNFSRLKSLVRQFSHNKVKHTNFRLVVPNLKNLVHIQEILSPFGECTVVFTTDTTTTANHITKNYPIEIIKSPFITLKNCPLSLYVSSENTIDIIKKVHLH